MHGRVDVTYCFYANILVDPHCIVVLPKGVHPLAGEESAHMVVALGLQTKNEAWPLHAANIQQTKNGLGEWGTILCLGDVLQPRHNPVRQTKAKQPEAHTASKQCSSTAKDPERHNEPQPMAMKIKPFATAIGTIAAAIVCSKQPTGQHAAAEELQKLNRRAPVGCPSCAQLMGRNRHTDEHRPKW